MATYEYKAQHVDCSVEIKEDSFVFAGKETLFSNLTGVALSYYVNEGSQLEVIRNLKEFIIRKIDKPRIDLSTPIDQVINELPKTYAGVPIYLDMIDNKLNRTIIPLDLQNPQSFAMLHEFMQKTKSVYVGFGNHTETDRALGVNNPGRTAKVVLFALALPIVFILFKVMF
mgnify:CR=1 FL=1